MGIESCVEQLANELVTISVKKHKLNRTHYGFDAVFELHDVIGDTGDGGTYTIENFYFDLCELPEKAMYGTFTALAYIIRNSERIACSSTTVEFRDEEDEYCERD
ncbi:unnamed protein product [Leptidea sinapis]|uniref:Uncharacterized protein n=1 Tax=Leptidea sinapis TaxID=189913 RepID=A0A5E4QC01_9NEOP|nr:unnamed protein product [Leptidea sinapis]